MALKQASFKPAWWLRSPHLQTLWPVIFKRQHKLELSHEQVELDDGDFIDLCWSKKSSDKIVLVLHGLQGTIDSHYANGIMYRLEQSGYRPVFMFFRGCSGRLNRLARAYHSGETGDLSVMVEHIKNKTDLFPYAVIGFSLGANVLLKWLSETGGSNPVEKAVAVSVPFKLHDAAERLENGLSKIYREYLLCSLRATYIKKFKHIDSPLNVDVNNLKSFWDYDDQVTAPLHGFDGAQDYYDSCSSRQFLKNIQIPTRIIHSLDDPFMFETTVPEDDELSSCVELLITEHGGHVGFVSVSRSLTIDYWCEDMIIKFLSE